MVSYRNMKLTLSGTQFVRELQQPCTLRQSPLHSDFPSFLKSLFPICYFLFHHFLRYFRHFHHSYVKLFIADVGINYEIPEKVYRKDSIRFTMYVGNLKILLLSQDSHPSLYIAKSYNFDIYDPF